MRTIPRVPAALKIGVLACAFLIAAADSPPVPPPPAPPIALAQTVLIQAAAYQDYMTRAAAITTDFKSGPDVAASLSAGESYDPQQLMAGAIAYAAVVALQDPDFVDSLRGYAADPAGRLQIRDALYNDPNYVLSIKGSDAAAGLVTASLMEQAKKLATGGAAVKQEAFDVQHQAWSKVEVVDRPERLAAAEASGANMPQPPADDVARLGAAADGTTPMLVLAPPAAPPYSPTVVRGLALAALAGLGQAGDDNAQYVAGFQNDTVTTGCLTAAKTNLYQCLAVAKPHYEDVFCLGQHAMADTAECVMIAAGAPPPVYTPLAPSKTAVAYGAKPATHAKRKHHGA